MSSQPFQYYHALFATGNIDFAFPCLVLLPQLNLSGMVTLGCVHSNFRLNYCNCCLLAPLVSLKLFYFSNCIVFYCSYKFILRRFLGEKTAEDCRICVNQKKIEAKPNSLTFLGLHVPFFILKTDLKN